MKYPKFEVGDIVTHFENMSLRMRVVQADHHTHMYLLSWVDTRGSYRTDLFGVTVLRSVIGNA